MPPPLQKRVDDPPLWPNEISGEKGASGRQRQILTLENPCLERRQTPHPAHVSEQTMSEEEGGCVLSVIMTG